MRTNKQLLLKGIKFLALTLLSMFTAPIILFQAFKNQEHAFYIPVLIFGLLVAGVAIALGFYSIKIIIDALLGNKK